MPINDTNCIVIIMPKIIGIKSPMRFIEGVKSIGNANKTNIRAIMVTIRISFGRVTCAINLFCLRQAQTPAL